MRKLLLLLFSCQAMAASWYVSPYGNNSNLGNGPGSSQAWQTINCALVTSNAWLSPGDTVYIAPGVYRETVTLTRAFATTPLYVRGDPRNEQGFTDGSSVRLDPGYVRWTSHTTSDKTASSASRLLLAGAATTNYAFFDVWLNAGNKGGTGSGIVVFETPSSTSANLAISFTRCVLDGYITVSLQAAADTPIGISLTNCVMYAASSCFYINAYASTAELDLDVNIIDSLLVSTGNGIQIVDETQPVTGVDMIGCTVIAQYCVVFLTDDTPTTKCVLKGNLFRGQRGIYGSTGSPFNNTYNLYDCTTARTGTGVTAGTGEQTGYNSLLELGQSALWLRKTLPFGMPLFDSPALAFRDDIGMGGTDLFGRVRPSGPGITWSYSTNAVGAMEYHDMGRRESTVVDDGTYSLKLTGPGDHQISVPVNASATILSIRVRHDTTYTGTMPQVQRIAQPDLITSDTGETLTSSATDDAWETLTFTSFTPTRKGVVYLRLISNDTAGNGVAYFDKVVRNY